MSDHSLLATRVELSCFLSSEGHLSHTWRQLNRNVANGIAKGESWLPLYEIPSKPPQVRSSQTPSYLPSFCTWRSSDTWTYPWFTGSLGCSCLALSLAELDWWQIHTPRSLAARTDPPCPGVGPFMEEAPSSPALVALSCQLPEGTKWGSGFPQVSWHVAIPALAPGKGLGLENGAVRPDDWLAFDSGLAAVFAVSPPFQVPWHNRNLSVWSLSWGQVLISTSAWGRGHGLSGFIPFPKILLNRLYCPGLWDFPKFCPSLEKALESLGLSTAPREESSWIEHLEKQPVEIDYSPGSAWKEQLWACVSSAFLSLQDSVAPLGMLLCKFQRGQTKTNYWAGLWEILTLTKDSTLQERQGGLGEGQTMRKHSGEAGEESTIIMLFTKVTSFLQKTQRI